MNAWKSDLDELRQQAVAETVEDPVAYKERLQKDLEQKFAKALEGCTLSDPDEKLIGRMRDTIRAGGPRMFGLPTRLVCGWQLNLSRWREAKSYKWHFAAVPWPQGRAPAPDDLELLAQFVRHIVPTVQANPTPVPGQPPPILQWQWVEAKSL